MVGAVALLLLSAVAIYFSCELFVNGVEWLGRQLKIGETAVGTVLAAFGTALPESVVTFVAVAFGRNAAAKEIGVGAALGGPLVLSTVAYAVVGATMVLRRKVSPHVIADADARRLAHDQTWFLCIFAFKIAAGLFAFPGKHFLGFAFLAAYGFYVWREMRAPESETAPHEDLEPLKLRPRDTKPALGWTLTQTAIALGVIFGASQLFVHQLEHVGVGLGLSPALAALLLSPLATELPETTNAIIWVRQGKHRLALANISGAMMIQATIPSAFGILFTPWLLDRSLLWGAAVTTVSVVGLLTLLRRRALTPPRLALFGLLDGVFAVGLIMLRHT